MSYNRQEKSTLHFDVRYSENTFIKGVVGWIDLRSDTIEAKLVAVNDDFITLTWSAREPKKIGKGKETVEKKLELPYKEIKEAIVTITF